ncbi:MAG: PAS domain S-box protein, partial [Polyangiaceae bacterium]
MARDADAARARALIGETGMAAVVAVAPDPIVLHREGQLIYLNRAALATLGYVDPEELLGVHVLDALVHPDDAELVVQRMARMTGPRAAATQPPVLVRFRRRDESIAWLEASAATVELDDGPATMVIAQDVSRARAQAQRFRTLFAVTAELETDDPASFERALAAMAEELGCDAAILSRISGRKYFVEHVHAPGLSLERGQVFQLGTTYCALTVEAGDVVAIHDMGQSEHRGHPCYEAFSLETYIGIVIRVAGD